MSVSFTSTAPGNATIAHELGSAPIWASVIMTSPGAIWFQSPVQWDSTNLYLVASDTGVSCIIELAATNVAPVNSSNIMLQNTVNWAQTFLGFAGLNIGISNEPAITSANIVMQTMLAPPFKWRWNRGSVSFPTNTTTATQDYGVSVAGFGHIENAFLTGFTNPIELQTSECLAVDSAQDRPVYISPQVQSGSTITFRLQPIPPTTPQGIITVNFQFAAPLFTGLSQTWAPIVDNYQYIYSWGFLALMQDYFGLPQAAQTRQKFIGALLAVAEGLTEQERNAFAAAWLGRDRNDLIAQMTAQLGERGRGI